MGTLLQDLRYALRQVGRAPMFTLTAVVVLALGSGANVAVFTVLSGILLRPLPYARPDRILTLTGVGSREFCCLSYANLFQLRDAINAKMQVGMILRRSEASVTGPGGRFQVQHATVTAGLFPMLGVKPMLGRTFRDEENEPGQDRVVLIDEEVWRKLYRSDRNIPGKTLSIQDKSYVIVGVMPKGFTFPFGTRMHIWTPEPLNAASRTVLSGEDAVSGLAFGRLPDGMSQEQLTASLSRTQSVITKEFPAGALPTGIVVTKYQQTMNWNVREPLTLLYAVVFGIWALSCLNVTGLTLARALGRSREHAVRAALGASRARLLQQTIVETLLLSGLGGVIGLVFGQISIKLMWEQITRALPLTSEIHVEWRVIACLAAIIILTTLLVGVIPALRAMHRNVQGSLHGNSSTASPGQNRTREVLAMAQIALTLVLLVGAGLFLRTIHALRQVPLGFTQENILTGGIMLNSSPLHGEAATDSQADVIRTAYLPLLERMRAIPGVQVAALSSAMPLRSDFDAQMAVKIDGKDVPVYQRPTASVRLASAGLAEAFGMRIVRGRFFTEDDQSTSTPVAVVNLAFANRYLSGQDSIGHTLSIGNGRFAGVRIVGMVGDMKQQNITGATSPEVYLCLQQTGPGRPLYGVAKAFMLVAVRGTIPADMLRMQFDKALHEVAPDATTTDVKTIHEAIENAIGSKTLIAHLLESFAGLALLIASVGLYGLLTFVVAQRTREIGVRIAMGAQRSDILMQVLRRALLLVGAGMTFGCVLASFTVKFATAYIYGVQAHDGLTFTAVVVVLAIASLLAAWLPARRAVLVDPMLVLRTE